MLQQDKGCAKVLLFLFHFSSSFSGGSFVVWFSLALALTVSYPGWLLLKDILLVYVAANISTWNLLKYRWRTNIIRYIVVYQLSWKNKHKSAIALVQTWEPWVRRTNISCESTKKLVMLEIKNKCNRDHNIFELKWTDIIWEQSA